MDRNLHGVAVDLDAQGSSPARGTWIEMGPAPAFLRMHPVIPRKGDVDRNPGGGIATGILPGHPPQGGRG